ncbi:MAG: PKD domain-containing protein, partial [Gammaproteobacteria bacterium]|nr:PKD domain-containing protein [Gammaproteobacteria bacterium]
MALIMINKRYLTGTYGVNAEHYLIQNIRLVDTRSTNSFTHNGVTESYLGFSRAIWSAGGQYITLQGMVVENNGSGVFIQANDDPGSLSKAWIIKGSKFENNGHGNRDHQVYFQAVSDPGEYNIVEGCYFGAPTPGQESIAQLKMRSTGVVVRYNYFNSAHRTLDIVEAQDAIPDWMYSHYLQQEILDYYRTSYVYGNIFVNDHQASSGQPSVRPLHFGADSFDEPYFSTPGAANGEPGLRGYEAPTYFFHNTFYMRADTAEMWRGVLFDAENNNSNGPTPTPGEVEAWNNIIEFTGDTRIGVMNRSGTTHFRGANLIYSSSLTIFAESDQYASTENSSDDPDVNVFYDGPILGQSANFVDATNPSLLGKNFMLNSGSPAIDQAAPLPAVLVAFPVDLQPAGITGGAVLRSSAQDLGAFASSTSNPTNQPPIAVIGVSSISALEVNFDGNGSSDPDGDALIYNWDFEDGNISTEQTPSHTYSQAGTYTVTLTVNDGQLDSNSAQSYVTVIDPTSNPVEIIIDSDDPEVSSTGTWGNATGASNHYGAMSVYATVGGSIDTFRFTPDFSVTAQFNVYSWNSCYNNRHTHVPHRIVHADGETIVEVDQNCDTGSSGEWYFLGQYQFAAGTNGFIEISDTGLDWPSTTYIGADAVRFEQVDTTPPVVDTINPTIT